MIKKKKKVVKVLEPSLGDTIKCSLSGFVGIASAKATYLHSEKSIGSYRKSGSQKGELVWFPIKQVKVIKRPAQKKN